MLNVITPTFPIVLQLAQACLALPTDEAGLAAKLACKCFLSTVSVRPACPALRTTCAHPADDAGLIAIVHTHPPTCTQFQMPATLISPPSLEPWIRLMLAITNRPIADEVRGPWRSPGLSQPEAH